MKARTSEIVRKRLLDAGAPFHANDNIAAALRQGDSGKLEREVEGHVEAMMDALVIDRKRDPNSKGTAKRVAKMFMREVFHGRYEPPPRVVEFPNVRKLDEVYTVGPIGVRSACSHHLVPVIGQAWVGVIPQGRLIGLSKFSRLAQWVLARPQIQEEAVVQLADTIMEICKPRALGIVIRANHLCMTWRGVKESGTQMSSSVMLGTFRESPAARQEFLSLIAGDFK